MKYLLIFLVVLSFISPSAEKGKTTSSVIKDGVYNYITCLDTSINYLVNNVPAFSKIAEIPYSKAYDKVMKNRSFAKHMVFAGETLDDIIKRYNSNIENIENFRKVVYKENPGIVTSSYEIKSGDYITVPTDQ